MTNQNNRGSLFKNEELKSDNHPLYSGNAVIGGVDYFMDAWVKKSASGKSFMSFSFKEKTKQRVKDLPGSPAADEDIPF